jgi:protein TonB
MRNFLSNVYTPEWLNLVFENRNKSYGAYMLRIESSKNMMRAFFIAAPVFILSFVLPQMLGGKKADMIADTPDRVVDITKLPPPPAKPLPPEPKAAQPAAPAEKLNTVKLPSHIKVVDQPVSEDEMPKINELKNAVVGQQSQSGMNANAGVVVPQTGDTGTGISDMPAADNAIHETSSLDAFPEFEGGMKAWARYIQRNLRYPQQAQEEGLQGKVFISFVIEKDGSISNVTVLRGVAGSLDQEAARVIQKSPKWKPGMQNNQSVRVRFNMPISFSLAE